MTGPDSDQWPIISEHATAWDWQSNAPCVEALGLADEGADDDDLLAVVSRYTIENLILNAVHEIGEWFRFDGQRLFPAHLPRSGELSDRDHQGNGSVTLQLAFEPAAHRFGEIPAVLPSELPRGRHLVSRLTDAAAASRFTYLPGTTISYAPVGPVIQSRSDDRATTAWRSTWSRSTSEATVVDDQQLVALVARDVHRALVLHEADRICRAFHVDGHRLWSLRVPEGAVGDPPDIEARDVELLSISIDYASTSSAATAHTNNPPPEGYERDLHLAL